jgi:outer membrane receptor protein involved in Fe transport
MPSFYALAQPFVGNPRLRPESSTAFDIGIEQKLGQRFGVIAGNLFRSAYRDLVDFSPELFRLVNRSEALARGGDLSWRLSLRTGVMIQAHATYSAIHLKDSPEPVRDRPRWRTGATLSIPIWSRTDLYAEGLFVASRFDFQLPVPQLNRAPSYFVANLAARRQIRQRISAFARLDNVLNRKYDEYVGFRNPGIQVRAGFDYSFR